MVEKVLIGSQAVEYHLGSNALRRSAKDADYLSLTPLAEGDVIDGMGILDQYPFESRVASLDEIYTLKVSHSPWVITGLADWSKHLRDIRTLQEAGCSLIEPLHSVAYRQWEERKGAKSVNLSQSRDDFFGGNLKRFFEHDSVHQAVAMGSRPAFYSILSPGSQVKPSRELFEALDPISKERLAFEEAMVLSLERDLIPSYMAVGRAFTTTEIYVSYRKQLRLLMTSYSKGWWPRWMIENYFDLITPPLDYWRLFWDSDKKTPLTGS